ncbi:MAG TPA: SAM-dependent chlorinase/fluorinase [Acidimicrobiales bacterium]|nr:SAM-dependent chlorinase/fluorinase [Acidimicrobiales bacterium]
MPAPSPPEPSRPPRSVFFLSDFGTEDEFVGVVHAVVAAHAPGTTVIDLTHHIPPFDVRAGSHTLVRAVPHLGPGVVVGVVDPGVGTVRRGVGLEVPRPDGGTLHFVGPDNGLLIAAAESAGEAPIALAFELRREPTPPDRGATFDGRDLFAPVAAALCTGTPLSQLGDAIEPESLVRLAGGVVERGRLHDGRACLRAEVTWVDHFGNLQLAATVADARVAGIPSAGKIELAARVESGREYLDGLPYSLVPDGVQLRCVDAFGELKQGEFGLLVDANGHLAVVAGEASAARWLNVVAGELLILAW